MPSPVGHAIAALTVYALVARDEGELLSAKRLGVVVCAALAPDLDLLARFVDGQNHHQQATHGIGFAILAAVCAAGVFAALRWHRPLALAGAVGLAWLSHILLDYLNHDANPPIGLMALWPWSRAYYKFPWPIFLEVGRSPSWHTLSNNILAAAWEAAVLLPVFTLVWRLRWRRSTSA